jgi:hypothetical protein
VTPPPKNNPVLSRRQSRIEPDRDRIIPQINLGQGFEARQHETCLAESTKAITSEQELVKTHNAEQRRDVMEGVEVEVQGPDIRGSLTEGVWKRLEARG